MSDASRAYQKQITGREGQAYLQNGVKFDGIRDGTLLEAKGNYNNFVDSSTGKFHEWFTGERGLIKQARSQIGASGGMPVNWYFSERTSMNAVINLLERRIPGEINFIFEPLK